MSRTITPSCFGQLHEFSNYTPGFKDELTSSSKTRPFPSAAPRAGWHRSRLDRKEPLDQLRIRSSLQRPHATTIQLPFPQHSARRYSTNKTLKPSRMQRRENIFKACLTSSRGWSLSKSASPARLMTSQHLLPHVQAALPPPLTGQQQILPHPLSTSSPPSHGSTSGSTTADGPGKHPPATSPPAAHLAPAPRLSRSRQIICFVTSYDQLMRDLCPFNFFFVSDFKSNVSTKSQRFCSSIS